MKMTKTLIKTPLHVTHMIYTRVTMAGNIISSSYSPAKTTSPLRFEDPALLDRFPRTSPRNEKMFHSSTVADAIAQLSLVSAPYDACRV